MVLAKSIDSSAGGRVCGAVYNIMPDLLIQCLEHDKQTDYLLAQRCKLCRSVDLCMSDAQLYANDLWNCVAISCPVVEKHKQQTNKPKLYASCAVMSPEFFHKSLESAGKQNRSICWSVTIILRG